MAKEKDVRVQVINSILTSPHRSIDPLIPIHNSAIEGDPLFYVKMGIWYQSNGSVRDHSKVFAAKIITSEYPEFRAVGEKLLTMMSPRDTSDCIFNIAYKHFRGRTGGKYRRIRKTVSNIIKTIEARSLTDNGVQMLRNYKVLRKLITKFHIPLNDTTLASLKFRHAENVKPYKAFEALHIIADKKTSEKKACSLIDKYKLPPAQVIGAIHELTPAIAASMLKGMSQAETVIFMKMFEKKGLTKNEEFTKLISTKLTKSKKNVSSVSMRSVKAAQSLSEGSGAKVMTVATDSFVSSLKKINKKVVLAIDKSNSMYEAITIGKEVAAILASTVKDPFDNLTIVVFDKKVTEVKVEETGDKVHSDFEKKFRYIKANGTTSLGSVIAFIDKKGLQPDVIVFITDGDECDTPLLNNAIAKSENIFNTKIINCKVGTPSFNLNISDTVLSEKMIEVENIDYKGDYYTLPNLVNVISSGGIMDTIDEIDAIDISAFISSSK